MSSDSLWSRIRKARWARVLAVYLGASWVVLEVTSLFRQEFGLPDWVTPLAIVLLLVGLVIIMATAWVQAHPAREGPGDEPPEAWEVDLGELGRSLARGRVPHLTWARAILGGLVAFSLLFGIAGAYVLFTQRGSGVPEVGAATPAGRGVAVLPFRVVGPEADLWREGLIDVLSTNLEGVPGLRKIDPRAILSHWSRTVGEGQEAADEREALQVASVVGARYALVGSMVGSESGVRIIAHIYDVEDGELRGSAQVEGSRDNILALADSLSLELLRAGLVASPDQIRPPDLSAATTTSLVALKAYLRGEQERRRSRWPQAASHYERALEADSTFALALARLSNVYGWIEGLSSPRVTEYARRAARFAERLPERERLMALGGEQLREGRLRGIEILQKVVARYPDDVEAWYVLGDLYVHIGDQGLHPTARYRDAFQNALELDPGFGPAYVHLIEDAFARQDSAEARELVARYESVAGGSDQVRGLALAYDLAWGVADSSGVSQLVEQSSEYELAYAINALRNSEDLKEPAIEVGRSLSRPTHTALREYGISNLAEIYFDLGRIREAREVASHMPEGGAVYWPGPAVAVIWHLLGYPLPDWTPDSARNLAAAPQPWDRVLIGALAAAEKRWPAVEAEITALEELARDAAAEGDTLLAGDHRAYAGAVRGYASLQRGELQAGVARLKESLARFPGVGPACIRCRIHGFLRYELARALLELGRLEEAGRYFESVSARRLLSHIYNSTPAEFYLGQVHERLGNPERARLHYGRFVRWWEDCDPELRPWLERGREALARLTGEPRA